MESMVRKYWFAICAAVAAVIFAVLANVSWNHDDSPQSFFLLGAMFGGCVVRAWVEFRKAYSKISPKEV
jgi:drug/metabolite transporter (DMT)-like permease